MSNLEFKNLNTLEGFKDFLQSYHSQLSELRSFPPLGIQKALHTAAPVFGYNDWHVMSSALQKATQPAAVDNREVVVVVVTTMDSDRDPSTAYTDVEILSDMAEAKTHVAGLVESKISRNDRSIEEVLDCRGISTPDDEDRESMDDDEVIQWICKENGIYELIDLVGYLDYGLTTIKLSQKWI